MQTIMKWTLLELKIAIYVIKKYWQGLWSNLDIAKGKTDELKHSLIENIQNEAKRKMGGKNLWHMKQIKTFNKRLILVPEGDQGKWVRSNTEKS